MTEEFRQLLQMARDTIMRGNFESSDCCCGDPMESHSIGSGHSPVDAEQYAAHRTIERIDEALARNPSWTHTPPRIPNEAEAQVVIDGANARRAHKEVNDNPYTYPADEWYSWHAGWMRPSMYIGDPK